MASAGSGILDSGDRLPVSSFETVAYGRISVPEVFGEGWGVFVLYRAGSRPGVRGAADPGRSATMDSRGAPDWIRCRHSYDKGLDFGGDGRAAPGGPPESLVQCSRKRRRCHRRTVLGDTMTRACLQPARTLDSATQKSRSLLRNFGRFTVFL
jgi:hypothetical protein